MPFSKVNSGVIVGIDAKLVSIEVSIDLQSLPSFNIVGLPSKEVEEAKERVRSSIKNSGYRFPTNRITVNLSPASLIKKGTFYDLAIAIGILKAQGDIKTNLNKYLIFGELSLNGDLNYIHGAFPLGLLAREKNLIAISPQECEKELLFIEELQSVNVKNLIEVVNHINGSKSATVNTGTAFCSEDKFIENDYDFKYIHGQSIPKRALEIASAGGHNISLIGPAGCGKTYLAKSFSKILPSIKNNESYEISKIHSIAGLFEQDNLIIERPFRSPHHSASKVGILGGGNPIKPGEVTLAHNGVLFLDEFGEFNKDIIESLRVPVEDKEIYITRSGRSYKMPSNFILIIASNPCPCGNFGNPKKECTCSINEIRKYQEKLSGPLFDRIDMHIKVLPVDLKEMANKKAEESSQEIRRRVDRARDIQNSRYRNLDITSNSNLKNSYLKEFCRLSSDDEKYCIEYSNKIGLSARGYLKVLKVARTIADLENSEPILKKHLLEAFQYRS